MSPKVIESGTIRQITYRFRRCTVFEIYDFKNAVTLKTRLGVRQGHWKCHRLIELIRLPTDVL